MNFFESIRVSFHSLGANKLRAALTMLGIIIGVGAVIALLAVGQGACAAITTQVQCIGSNLVFVFPGAISQSGVRTATGATTLTLADANALGDPVCCPDIAGIAPMFTRISQVTGGGNNTNVSVSGITPSFERVRNFRAARGRFVDERDVDTAARVAALGTATVKTLFGTKDPIGETIRINTV